MEGYYLPAIAEGNNPLGRILRTPLCPELYDLTDFEDIQKDLGESDYAALYKGNPLSEKGNLFKLEYFRYFEIKDDLFILHKPNGNVIIPVRFCTCFQTYNPTGSSKSLADYGALRPGISPHPPIHFWSMY